MKKHFSDNIIRMLGLFVFKIKSEYTLSLVSDDLL